MSEAQDEKQKKGWWSEHGVAMVSAAVSCFALVFSYYAFHRQFKLDMRPFVGITKVDVRASNDGLLFDAIVHNVGKLPASEVAIDCEWEISDTQNHKVVFTHREPEARFLLFPTSEVKYSVPFQGTLFDSYLNNAQYEVSVEYKLEYGSKTLDETWKTLHRIIYNKATGLKVVAASGT